jgi:hypothetical protein
MYWKSNAKITEAFPKRKLSERNMDGHQWMVERVDAHFYCYSAPSYLPQGFGWASVELLGTQSVYSTLKSNKISIVCQPIESNYLLQFKFTLLSYKSVGNKCVVLLSCWMRLRSGPSSNRTFLTEKKKCLSSLSACLNFAPFHPDDVHWCFETLYTQEAKYVESWASTTSAWAGWSRFDILVDRYGGVHSLLICTIRILESPTCH